MLNLENYILANDLLSKTDNMDMANLSILIVKNGEEDIDFKKFNYTIFINKNSELLSNNLNKIISENNFIDFHKEKLIPFYFFKEEFLGGNNLGALLQKVQIQTIYNKKFVKIIDKELEDLFYNPRIAFSVVKNSEVDNLISEKYIKGFYKLNNTNTLTYY